MNMTQQNYMKKATPQHAETNRAESQHQLKRKLSNKTPKKNQRTKIPSQGDNKSGRDKSTVSNKEPSLKQDEDMESILRQFGEIEKEPQHNRDGASSRYQQNVQSVKNVEQKFMKKMHIPQISVESLNSDSKK